MIQKWKRVCCVCLLAVTMAGCGKKTTESSQSNVLATAPIYVKIMETPLKQPVFEVKSVRADWVNGFINVAITSTTGSMLQINGIAEKDFKAGALQGDAFRLVYMPGGLVSACTSNDTSKNKLQLQQLSDKSWSLTLLGAVVCDANLLQFDLKVVFDQPESTQVIPNH
jgi:hypothetical protein